MSHLQDDVLYQKSEKKYNFFNEQFSQKKNSACRVSDAQDPTHRATVYEIYAD